MLERPLRVPWTAKRSNQSILKEINPDYLLEGLMLKLKLQYFGHLMWRADSLEKTLMLGKIEGRRRSSNRGWDGWMASLTQWTWVWANSRRQCKTGKPGVLQSMGSQSQTRLTNWTTTYTNWDTLNIQCACSLSSVMSNCDPVDCSTPGFPVLHHFWSLLKLISIELMMPSNHLILCCPLLSCPQSFPASGSFLMSQLFASGSIVLELQL